MLLVADSKHCEGCQSLGIGDDARDVDPAAGELLADEASEVIVSDAWVSSPGFAEPQSRRTDRGIRGTAAHVLGEGTHVFQPPADLLAVEVHGGPADRDQVERWAADRFRHVVSRCCGTVLLL